MRVTSRGRHAAAGRLLVILDAFEGQDDAELAWLGSFRLLRCPPRCPLPK